MNSRKRGHLIVFSGLDGAGKTTQIELLLARLNEANQRPRYLWTRGGYTPLFDSLKSLLRRLPGKVVPNAGPSAQRTQTLGKSWVRHLWLTIALLDLLWIYCVQIRWWIWRGETLVCDRYIWDTLIDFRLNFPTDQVEQWRLWSLLQWASPRPDLALALTIPVDESLRRSKLKEEPFPDAPEVLRERLRAYQELTSVAGWLTLDGRESVETLADKIAVAVAALRDPNVMVSA